MRRFYIDGERAVHFCWKPRWQIAEDCPFVCVRWLWWLFYLWLIPHDGPPGKYIALPGEELPAMVPPPAASRDE